jgi:hypothetical protein
MVKASDALETQGGESFCVDVWACFTASPATADIESCVTRTYSRAELRFPSLSIKGRTTSNCRILSLGMADHDLDTYLHSDVSVEVQAKAVARC